MEKDKVQTTIETYNNITQEYIYFYKSNIENGKITLHEEIKYIVSKLKNNSKILDAGTAIGEYPRYLTEKYNKNFNVIGIDTSENMLKKATDFAPKAKFLQMDIRDLKFNSNTFDAVICFATLIHVDDKTCINVLNKFDDILKEEGIIAINVMEHLKGDKEIFIKEPFNENYMTYYNRYSKQFFIDYFTNNNYRVDKIFNKKIYKESNVGKDLSGTNEFTIIAKKIKK